MLAIRDESGQAIVLVAVTVTFMLVMFAFVVNVGSWFATDRNLQNVADQAALAGATYAADGGAVVDCSSSDPGTCAATYVANNHVTLDNAPVVAGSGANISVTVNVKDANPPQFLRDLLGINSTRRATATAATGIVGSASNIVPITIASVEAATFGNGTQVTMTTDKNAQGTFGIIGICSGGSTPDVAACVSDGCSCTVNVGETYPGITGAKFNSNPVTTAFEALCGTTVLVPVYDSNPDGSSTQGSNYKVIGFAELQLAAPPPANSCFKTPGNTAQLIGTFVKMISTSQGAAGGGTNNFGAAVVALTR